MGYPVQRFVAEIDPNLICGICSCVLQDASLTPCGHSFCSACLITWLSRPETYSCPECRSTVRRNDVKPILSLRNLISALKVECDYKDRGCETYVKVDELENHAKHCGCAPVQCVGCSQSLNKSQLPDHQMQCSVIAEFLADDDGLTFNIPHLPEVTSHEYVTSISFNDLTMRMASLETQINKLRKDKLLTENRNKSLEKECDRAKRELQIRKSELLDLQFSDFDPDYEYGQTGESVAKLSFLIAKYLLRKPTYIERDRVFTSIRRCYERFSRNGDHYENDVHMLLATSFASNWFSESQRFNIHCWLQSIARYRARATWLEH